MTPIDQGSEPIGLKSGGMISPYLVSESIYVNPMLETEDEAK